MSRGSGFGVEVRETVSADYIFPFDFLGGRGDSKVADLCCVTLLLLLFVFCVAVPPFFPARPAVSPIFFSIAGIGDPLLRSQPAPRGKLIVIGLGRYGFRRVRLSRPQERLRTPKCGSQNVAPHTKRPRELSVPHEASKYGWADGSAGLRNPLIPLPGRPPAPRREAGLRRQKTGAGARGRDEV